MKPGPQPQPHPGRLAGMLALLVLAALASASAPSKGTGKEKKAAEQGTVVYANDFETPPGTLFPGWTSSRIVYERTTFPPMSGSLEPPPITNVRSPRGNRQFLGEFGGPRVDRTARTRVFQTVRLSLDRLPPHARATVSFDLLILKSWDGNSPQYGRDRWVLRVVDGPTLLDTTFSNNPKVAREGSSQDYPRPGSAPHQGKASSGTLGYDFFGDSAYHLSFTFPHTGPNLALEFASDLFEGKGLADESWGLDNVTVRVAPK